MRINTNFGVSKRYALALAISFLSAASALADNIHGKVIDSKTKDPIVGASITLKGDKGGKTLAITDIDGKFTADIKSFPSTIVIGYTGYNSEEYDIYEATNDDIQVDLTDNFNALNEVVVVGYGTQKRQQLTGSITKVSSDVFDNFRTSTIDEALGGAATGLDVTQSGQPGAGSQIRIRGGNSVNASNNPLYVIDGFLYYQDASAGKTGIGGIESSIDPLSFINPSDIESIEVLKDNSATAIYGSRGANGVIIITTKKGSRGKDQVRYSTNITVSSPAKKLKVLDASEWAGFEKKYFNRFSDYTDEDIANLGKGTDWQDAVLRTSVSQIHELSFEGGNDKTRYLISGNYTDQKGIVLNSDFKRYNLRANIERELSSKFKLNVTTTLGKSKQNSLSTTQPVNYRSSPFSAGITNSLTYALFMPPVVPIYNADGSYNYKNPYENSYFAIGDRSANPVSDLKNTTAESINKYILANAALTYNVLDGLVAKFSVGANLNGLTQNYFAPSYSALGLNEQGVGSIGHKDYEADQTEFTLTYTKNLGTKHFIDALAGYTFQHTKTNYNTSTTSHYTNETLGFNNLAGGSQVYTPISGESKSNLHSIIARINYTYNDRYNATVTFRADHSSRFAKDHRWGYFPSFGLSWNINKESFIPKDGIISNLKLRASYGTVGNQEIGDYEYAQSYRAVSYGGETAYTLNNLGNSNLKWETTAQTDIGLDAGFFKDRLNLVIDYYWKKTRDLLLAIPVNSSTGTSTQLANIGNVKNSGLEIGVNGTIIRNRNLLWTATVNFSTNSNKLTKIGNGVKELISGDNSENILREGEPVGSFYGLKFQGIDPETGEVVYQDQNGDGKINAKDRVILGSYQPDYFYGISSAVKYQNWDFSISFKGSHGNKAYNSLRRHLDMATASYNVSRDLLSSWTPENTHTNYPRVSGYYQTSYIDSRYIEGASYFKLQNVSLGYTFHTHRIISSLRLYVSGQNLFTITDYKGYDPELNNGLDQGAYPTARSFAFGADVTF